MKLKFNKYERIAGLFVVGAAAGVILSAAFIAVKRGWFAPRVNYVTNFESAEGVHPGTSVQIAGLRAGSVDEVDLLPDNKIRVSFSVFKKYQDKIRTDSVAQLIRPFVIGERILEITVGKESQVQLDEHAFIPSLETIDMMALLSGRKLGDYLDVMSGMMRNLKTLAEAFANQDRAESIVKTFDQIEPLVKNLNHMSLEVVKLAKQANKNENLGVVLGNLAVTTKELNAMLPELKEKAPQMSQDIQAIVQNMALLTENMKLFIPALTELAPQLPHTTRRAVEALDETVVILKAMQKSMFLRGSVEQVREEEAKRLPANK